MSEAKVQKSAHTKDDQSFNWSSSQVVNLTGDGTVQGVYFRAKSKIYANPEAHPQKELSHKDKLAGYVQTSGQLGGALGLVVSGLLEGNLARAALGGFNSLRSTTKLVSDFNAKSNAKSHRNDMVEGGVAASANSVGFLNMRSPEEMLAVAMGVTAWATKGIQSFIHMRREKKLEDKQAEIESNNLFFKNNQVVAAEDTPEPKVMGFVHRGLEAIKDKALETTFFVMSHAPPVMMGTRAVSYLVDGINNGDLAMAGGGASFIVGATLMAFKDHKSYMKARAERKAKAEDSDMVLKTKFADDFENAEYGEPVNAIAEIDGSGNLKMKWGIKIDDAVQQMEDKLNIKTTHNIHPHDDKTVHA